MPGLSDLLNQLATIHPAWAGVLGLVAYLLRSNGWLRLPSLTSSTGSAAPASDPLAAKLQARVTARYRELASAGQEEEAFYFLFKQLTKNPGDKP